MDAAIFKDITNAFQKIGYKSNLIKTDYLYADLFSSTVIDRTVRCAGFGQEPLDYRLACFGLVKARPGVSDVVPFP